VELKNRTKEVQKREKLERRVEKFPKKESIPSVGNEPLLLSIESSCDDTAVAITGIETLHLYFHKRQSQATLHSPYGGVVPELASRLHLEAFPKLIEECRPYFSQLGGIGVTNRPGLAITLQEGVMVAKALALALNLPLIEINHLIGHIYSLFIERPAITPMLVLLVSGGHTQLLWFEGVEKVCQISTTLDDSLGEAFDKTAKLLGFGYPGGPIIEKLARKRGRDLGLPIPLKNNSTLNFSFSGLKNAVRLAVMKKKGGVTDIAYSFQKSAITHILQKTERAIQKWHPPHLGIVGGVSANLEIRRAFLELATKYKFTLHYPKLEFCSDNGAMIGRAGVELFKLNRFTPPDQLEVKARTPFPPCSP